MSRKSFLRTVDLLGLVLWWLKCKDCLYRICVDFGIVSSSASIWLDFAAEVLLKVVQRRVLEEFVIRWPSAAEMRK